MTRALFASLLVSSLIGCNGSDLTVEEDRHRAHDMARPNDLASGGGTGGNGSGDMATSSNPDLATGGGGTGGGGGGTPGSGLFPSTAPWYTDITNAPKDAQSDAAIAAMNSKGGWGTGKMQIDFCITVLHANASTPMMSFTTTGDFYSPDCDFTPVPGAGRRRARGRDRLRVHRRRRLPPASSSTTRSTSSTRCGARTSSARTLQRRLPRRVGPDQGLPAARPRRRLHQRRRRRLPDRAAAVHRRRGRGRRDRSRDPLHPAQRPHRQGTLRAPGDARHHASASTTAPNSPPYGVRLRLRADYPLDSLPTRAPRWSRARCRSTA